jgi:hypothetical protein
MKDIARLCLNCLKMKLADDYAQFEAHALVIEPTANLPCYVFQPSSKWKDSKLAAETGKLLSNMETTCHQCGGKANFLWLTSKELTETNAEKMFTEGVSETLLRWGNGPLAPSAAGVVWTPSAKASRTRTSRSLKCTAHVRKMALFCQWGTEDQSAFS